MTQENIHPEEQSLFQAWLTATQDRYYLQYVPGGDWKLWERVGKGEHTLLATFHDGDKNGSPLAETIADFLNVMATIGTQKTGRQYIPLTQEELNARAAQCNARLQAR